MENRLNNNNYHHNTHPRDWDDAELVKYIIDNRILTDLHLQTLNPTTEQMVNLVIKHEIDSE